MSGAESRHEPNVTKHLSSKVASSGGYEGRSQGGLQQEKLLVIGGVRQKHCTIQLFLAETVVQLLVLSLNCELEAFLIT